MRGYTFVDVDEDRVYLQELILLCKYDCVGFSENFVLLNEGEGVNLEEYLMIFVFKGNGGNGNFEFV